MVLDYTVGAQGFISGTLRAADLKTGTITQVLPGVAMSEYDLTHDGKQVVFAAYDEQHKPHLWSAPLDRSSPPHQLFPEEADQPQLTDAGVIYYRARNNGTNHLFRYKPDGSREEVGRVLVNEISSVSPDGKWVSAWMQNPTDPKHSGNFLINTSDGSLLSPCRGCTVSWSQDGRRLMVFNDPVGRTDRTNSGTEIKTLVISLKPGEDLPPISPDGWKSAADFKGHSVQQYNGTAVPSPDGHSYVYAKRTAHRNLFRIPLG